MSTEPQAKRTPLYPSHLKLGGRLVPFAGWEMPVNYTAGLLAEHQAVRTAVGLFDVSHMGQFIFEGAGAVAAVDRLVTNDIQKLEVAHAAYAGLLNERGTFIDDVFVYKLAPDRLLMVVNASNVEKDFDWVVANCPQGLPQNKSDAFALIAVQGPRAVELVQSLAGTALPPSKNSITEGTVAGHPALIARSGYTGEDGFELFVAPNLAVKIWDALLEKGQPLGILPCGLGARDSLRTEVKNALYGNDIDDAHTPLEAGMNWVVKLDGPDFIGKAALVAQKAGGLTRKLVGFETDKPIPRHGYPILKDGVRVGEVTSGTLSPTLGRPIGMGYVPLALSIEGATFDIEIRGKAVPARWVKTPFYKRPV